MPVVRGRNLDIEHLHGRELVEHATRREPRGMRPQLLRQRGVQAVGEEGDEDVRLDARLVLVIDRPDRP